MDSQFEKKLINSVRRYQLYNKKLMVCKAALYTLLNRCKLKVTLKIIYYISYSVISKNLQ